MATYTISLTKGTGISSFSYTYYDSSNTLRSSTAYSSLTLAAYSGTLIRITSVSFSSGYTYPVTCGSWTMYNASGTAVDPTISVNANRSLTISATKQASTTKYSVTIQREAGVASFSVSYIQDGVTKSQTYSSERGTFAADYGTSATITNIYPSSGYGAPYTIKSYSSSSFSTVANSWLWTNDKTIQINGTRHIGIEGSKLKQTFYGRLKLNGNGGTFSSGRYTEINWPRIGYQSATAEGTSGVYMTITLPTSSDTDYLPTRDGYKFLGWGTSAFSTTASYYNGSQVGFTATSLNVSSPTEFNLYALWSKTYTLSYSTSYSGVTNMPSNVENITSGTGVVVSSVIPVKQGYSFVGWSRTDGGTATLFGGSNVYVTADVTLWTVFEKNAISYFYWNGSDTADTALIAKGQPVSNITAARWNRLLAKIKELADACGASFSYTTVSSGDGITAARFNAARTGLNNIKTALGASTTLPAAQSSGGTIYATLFNGSTSIKGALNALIGVYNNG